MPAVPIAPLIVTPVVVIVSPSLAPTWKEYVPPSSRTLPLNFVSSEMFFTSLAICETSAAIASLSSVDRVPLLYWTFRSRTRCSIECTSLSAPSAVWTSEMPSCALRCA